MRSDVVIGDDGKFYMAAAEMYGGCDLGAWTTNSQVALAVSDNPLGPYTKYATAVPPWSHNPEIVRHTDGTYLIFTLGDGVPHGPLKKCGRSEEEAPATAAGPIADRTAGPIIGDDNKNQTVRFVIHYSKSLQGPWSSFNTSIVDLRSQDNMGNVSGPTAHCFIPHI